MILNWISFWLLVFFSVLWCFSDCEDNWLIHNENKWNAANDFQGHKTSKCPQKLFTAHLHCPSLTSVFTKRCCIIKCDIETCWPDRWAAGLFFLLWSLVYIKIHHVWLSWLFTVTEKTTISFYRVFDMNYICWNKEVFDILKRTQWMSFLYSSWDFPLFSSTQACKTKHKETTWINLQTGNDSDAGERSAAHLWCVDRRFCPCEVRWTETAAGKNTQMWDSVSTEAAGQVQGQIWVWGHSEHTKHVCSQVVTNLVNITAVWFDSSEWNMHIILYSDIIRVTVAALGSVTRAYKGHKLISQ